MIFKLTHAQAKALGSRRRKGYAIVSENPTKLLDVNWREGSRSSYTLWHAATGRKVPMPADAKDHYCAWDACGPSVPELWPIPAGYVLMDCGTSCGKPAFPCLRGTEYDVCQLLAHFNIEIEGD